MFNKRIIEENRIRKRRSFENTQTLTNNSTQTPKQFRINVKAIALSMIVVDLIIVGIVFLQVRSYRPVSIPTKQQAYNNLFYTTSPTSLPSKQYVINSTHSTITTHIKDQNNNIYKLSFSTSHSANLFLSQNSTMAFTIFVNNNDKIEFQIIPRPDDYIETFSNFKKIETDNLGTIYAVEKNSVIYFSNNLTKAGTCTNHTQTVGAPCGLPYIILEPFTFSITADKSAKNIAIDIVQSLKISRIQ